MHAELPVASFNFSQVQDGELGHVMIPDRHRPHVIERPHGRRCHPYSSGHALVYQAFAPAADGAAYRNRYPFFEYGAEYWADESALNDFLAEVRARGCAVPPVRRERQFRVVVPVRAVVGGVSPVGQLGGYLDDTQPAAVKQQLIELVTGVAATLGRVAAMEPASDAASPPAAALEGGWATPTTPMPPGAPSITPAV